MIETGLIYPASVIVILNLIYVREGDFLLEYAYLVIKMNTTFTNR